MKYNLFIGRFSPFHLGHKTIIDSFVKNGKPVCIAIRESDDKYPVAVRAGMIKAVYIEEIIEGIVKVIIIPDIETVIVGRDVGFSLVEVPDDIKVISGKNIRNGSDYDNLPPGVKERVEAYDKIIEQRKKKK